MEQHRNQTEWYKTLLSICFTPESIIMFDVGNCITDNVQETKHLSIDEVEDAFYSTTEGRTTHSQSLAISCTLSETTLRWRLARSFPSVYLPYPPLLDIAALNDTYYVN